MRNQQLINELANSAYQRMISEARNSSVDQLLTASEKTMIGRRILIAQAIIAGKTRMEINEKIGVSPNTFAQIRKWIEDEFLQYDSAYSPAATNNSQDPRRRAPGSPFSFEEMSRKYPGHFLLLSGFKKLFK